MNSTPKYLGKYRIVKVLGKGGMGTVYLAYDEKLKRNVAIKVTIHSDMRAKKRMVREIQNLADVQHPHILKIYEAFIVDNMPCLVMEYIDGITLDQCIQSGNLSMVERVYIFEKVVEAIDYAHQKGIIHRDIKPSNIIVDKNKHPYVMDFGLAKKLKVDSDLTKTGSFLGTAHYMSPEQANGEIKTLDARSDIYSLGTTLYELICNTRVVKSSYLIEILQEVNCKDPVPPREINDKIPQDLEYICLRALQKNKKYRYQNAGVFACDLRYFLEKKPIKMRQYYWQKKTKLLLLLASVPLVVIGIFFATVRPTEKHVKIDIEDHEVLLNNAFNLVGAELYGESLDVFNSLANKDLTATHRQKLYIGLLIANAKQQNWSLVSKYYQKYFKKRNNSHADLIMAQMFFTLGEWSQAKKYFPQQVEPKNALDFYYLQGRIYYRTQEYKQAINAFVKGTETASAIISSEQYRTLSLLKLYHAKAHFQAHKTNQIPLHLQKAIKILQALTSKLPRNVEVFEYLAMSIAKKGDRLNLVKAEAHLQKCIKLQPQNSKYHNLLAKVQTDMKKYNDAHKNIMRAIEYSSANPIAAMSSFLKLAYFDATRQKDCSLAILHYSQTFAKIERPDFIENKVKNIAKKYHEAYIQLKWWRQQHNKQQIKLSNDIVSSENTVSVYINLLRHHTHLQQKVASYLSKNNLSSEKNKWIENALHRSLAKRKKEINAANYYRLAHLYLHSHRTIFEESNSTVDYSNIKEIFCSDTEPLHRYLAAKALLFIGKSRYLEQQIVSPSSSMNKLLCTIVLREALMTVDWRTIADYFRRRDNPSYFISLAAIRSLYILGEDNSDKIPLIKRLLFSKQKSIRIYAAELVFKMQTVTPKMWKKAEGIFLESMNDKKIKYRSFSHFCFWHNKKVQKTFLQYQNQYVKGWKEPEKKMRLAMIRSIPPNFGKVEKISNFANYLVECIREEKSVSSLQLDAINLLATYNPNHSYLHKIITSEKQHPIVQIVAYFCVVNNKFFLVNKNQNMQELEHFVNNIPRILKNVDYVRDHLQQVSKKNYHPHYKMAVYYLSAILGCHMLETIKTENVQAKAHIIRSLCSQKYGIVHNIVQTYNHRMTNFFVNAYNRKIADKWNTKQKKQLINKYVRSKNSIIQKNALTAKYTYASEQERYELFTRYKKKSAVHRKQLAQSIYNSMEFRLHLFSDMLATHSPKGHYYRYLNQLLDSIKKSNVTRSKMHNCIEHALELDPQNIKYLFEKACILLSEGKILAAIKKLRIILNLPHDKNHIFQIDLARLQLAEIYCEDTTMQSEEKQRLINQLIGIPPKNIILKQDIVYLLKTGRIYANLGLWKCARQIFDHVYFQLYRKMSVPTAFKISTKNLNEGDKERVVNYLQKLTLYEVNK
ncbi:protein kinase [Candidatus Uabimicrobium sp. HlEnr_7]|uniref:protein kinase domain-containing protein n=1 Tax=Candidatus Uabimicrobium helgolandensis TaxID=3095367 RepID=UPI003555CD32